ncbi:hypothetical protein AB0346_18725 [Nocardia beijingensis]|uniref:hypothetical protein n=1 Tax=Nocardia beijingensis TaxID=95162 RepID=UPI00344C33E2
MAGDAIDLELYRRTVAAATGDAALAEDVAAPRRYRDASGDIGQELDRFFGVSARLAVAGSRIHARATK